VFAVLAILLMDVLGRAGLDRSLYGIVVPAGAAALAAATALYARSRSVTLTWFRRAGDTADLLAIGLLFLVVVGAFRVAMVGFGPEQEMALFISFAAGLLLGVAGPIVYTRWIRKRPLEGLGLTARRWKETVVFGLVLAGAQYANTLRGYPFPEPEGWVPLLLMSLVVGLFEAIFFRGFVQGRLEASFGLVPAVTAASGLYALYHIGYGMGGAEMVFLFGLGVVYAVAFRIVRNILVLWPLLVPLGAFYNNLVSGDISLPWISMLGFGEVLAVMGVVIWLAQRRHG
jgi:membrane protease YdiL (CAAX protease family)